MESKVDWEFATSVGNKIARRVETPDSYMADSIDDDFSAMTAQAEQLVAEESGLSPDTKAKSKVIDRSSWVDANIASFRRLMRPLFERVEDTKEEQESKLFSESQIGMKIGSLSTTIDPIVEGLRNTAQELGPKTAGLEIGALLGFMSARVLGQYDLLITEDDSPEDQDWVYYVGPNILTLEQTYGFPPKEFRLWIAIHECTHRAQFMAVPWLRSYYISMVDDLLKSLDTNPKKILESLKNSRNSDTDDSGIAMKMATPEQRKIIDRLSALMSLLEGHGDVVMDRAGKDLIPSQPRFAKVMKRRRQSATGINKLIQKITGMDTKLAQYEAGENFITQVEDFGGRELFDQVWMSPESLPTMEEIKNPRTWIDRVS